MSLFRDVNIESRALEFCSAFCYTTSSHIPEITLADLIVHTMNYSHFLRSRDDGHHIKAQTERFRLLKFLIRNKCQCRIRKALCV